MYQQVPKAPRTYRFDAFEVDGAAGELRKDEVKVPLQDVPFRLLVALLEHPGELRSREELRREIWPADVHLDFDAALATAVHKVRQALGDEADHARYIETLPGRGFRFIETVLTSTGAADHGPDRSAKRFPVWITAAGLAGIAVVALVLWGVRSRMSAAPAPIRSIAVLPLEYLGNAVDQEYFADGMTDAISTELGRIPGFDKVISWQSMKGYKKTTKPLGAIAKELEVEALVQGTVQREGTQIRISARLFRTDPERQVWAWSYDRDQRDVLAMQREVAREVAREVQGSVATAIPASAAPSVAPAAYDFYLHGILHMQRALDRTAVFTATRQFEQAVALDPGFALAHARLSMAHMDLWFYHHDRTEARRLASLESARTALRLDPGKAAGHLAMGKFLYQGLLDYPKALVELEAARKIDPNDFTAETLLGSVKRRQGKWPDAIQHYQRAVALNPRQGSLLYHLGVTLGMCRKYEEADGWFQRSLQLEPLGQAFAGRAILALGSNRAELARSTLEEARKAGHRHPTLTHAQFQMELWSGHPDAALAGLATEPEVLDWQVWYLPKALLQAQAFALAGQADAARRHYDLARRVLEEKARSDPEDDRFPGALGIAYAGLGRTREALAAGRSALALPAAQKDVFHDMNRRADLARVYTMVGEVEEALRELDGLLSVPSHLSIHALRSDPAWAPLRGAKGYQELLRKYGN